MLELNIQKIRQNKNMSQTLLGDLAGISQNHVSNIESNKKKQVSIKHLTNIAEALNVCSAELVVYNCNSCVQKRTLLEKQECRIDKINKGYNPNSFILDIPRSRSVD